MGAVVATRTDSFTVPPACTRELIVVAPMAELRLTLRLPPAVIVLPTLRVGAASRMSPSPVETEPLSVSVPAAARSRSLTVLTAEPRIVRLPVPLVPERIRIGALLAPTASTIRSLASSIFTV